MRSKTVFFRKKKEIQNKIPKPKTHPPFKAHRQSDCADFFLFYWICILPHSWLYFSVHGWLNVQVFFFYKWLIPTWWSVKLWKLALTLGVTFWHRQHSSLSITWCLFMNVIAAFWEGLKAERSTINLLFTLKLSLQCLTALPWEINITL